MHVHVGYAVCAMRTTIELPDALRAKLLAMAAARGEKGFSRLIQEAVELYLKGESVTARQERVRRALSVLGSLGAEGADGLEAAVKDLRRKWR